jgi:hypothetical protein
MEYTLLALLLLEMLESEQMVPLDDALLLDPEQVLRDEGLGHGGTTASLPQPGQHLKWKQALSNRRRY